MPATEAACVPCLRQPAFAPCNAFATRAHRVAVPFVRQRDATLYPSLWKAARVLSDLEVTLCKLHSPTMRRGNASKYVPLLSNPRAPPGLSRKKLDELLLDTLNKVLRQAENQHPQGAACAHKISQKFTRLKPFLHMTLKSEKNRLHFLKFAVYGTPTIRRPLQIPYRENVKQFVPREYLKRCAYIKTQKTRSRNQPDARRTDLGPAPRGGIVDGNWGGLWLERRRGREVE